MALILETKLSDDVVDEKFLKTNIKPHEAERVEEVIFKDSHWFCVFSWEGSDLEAHRVDLYAIGFG